MADLAGGLGYGAGGQIGADSLVFAGAPAKMRPDFELLHALTKTAKIGDNICTIFIIWKQE